MEYLLLILYLVSGQDPGYPLLKKLIGESKAKVFSSADHCIYTHILHVICRVAYGFDIQDLVSEFLFQGVNSLGSKSFLDYFPEYARDDGTVNKKRSMIGKSFETRPWDATGQFNAG
jgi:phytochromobilin:ferredoxin oxidoreductase